jgi:hypothetical protein
VVFDVLKVGTITGLIFIQLYVLATCFLLFMRAVKKLAFRNNNLEAVTQ